MKGERTIAGMRCSEVLARLEGYVAETLAEDERGRVVAHVSECSLCADFGDRYAKTIASIRRAQAELPESPEVKTRLLGRLAGLR